MDILGQRGELSRDDLLELQVMSREELVGLVVGLNREWYRLLEALEDSHRQELKRVEDAFLEKLSGDLKASKSTHEDCLTSLERKLTDGLDSTKKTNALLVALEKSASRK